MFWWGKVVAGGLGALFGGPLVGLAAAGIGHQWDRDLAGLMRAHAPVRDPQARERLLWLRRTARFGLAGALARVAALPPARRAAVLEGLLAAEGLDRAAGARAQALFRDGERADFPLTAVVNQFRRAFAWRPDLAQALVTGLLPVLEGLDDAAPARRLLQDIARRLGVASPRMERLAAAWQATQQALRPSGHALTRLDAAKILGVSATAPRTDVTRAYRRLLSRYHPDKLVHQNPSPAALAEATRRTDQIRKAYRRLSRDWTD